MKGWKEGKKVGSKEEREERRKEAFDEENEARRTEGRNVSCNKGREPGNKGKEKE